MVSTDNIPQYLFLDNIKLYLFNIFTPYPYLSAIVEGKWLLNYETYYGLYSYLFYIYFS